MTSERAQRIMIWVTLIFMAIFCASWIFLLKLFPLPPATVSAIETAQFYKVYSLQIRVGAAINSWTGGFLVPIAVVIAIQMARLERGIPAWSILQFAGGTLGSLFLLLPPLFWGIAAFSPDRAPEITQVIHEMGALFLVSTDQFIILQTVPVIVISLTRTDVPFSPFSRWYGYYTIWAGLIFEAGAAGLLTKVGPFAWNGLFVFWFPGCVFCSWLVLTSVLILKALKLQEAASVRI